MLPESLDVQLEVALAGFVRFDVAAPSAWKVDTSSKRSSAGYLLEYFF